MIQCLIGLIVQIFDKKEEILKSFEKKDSVIIRYDDYYRLIEVLERFDRGSNGRIWRSFLVAFFSGKNEGGRWW